MKNLILAIIITLSTGCASMELKQHKAFCRHDALFVASVLVDHYPPESVFIEVSQAKNYIITDKEYYIDPAVMKKPKPTHAQAYVKDGANRIYFSRWHNIAVESPRDEVSGDIIRDYTIKQFIDSNRKWRL